MSSRASMAGDAAPHRTRSMRHRSRRRRCSSFSGTVASSCAALVALFCFARGGAPSTISSFPSGWTPRLPTQLDEWTIYLPSFNQNSTTEAKAVLPAALWQAHPVYADALRVPWRLADLEPALAVVNHQQFRPLLQKLHAGRPIQVLGYGSSVTHDQAGCFHTGPASHVASKVHARGMPSWSYLYRDDLPEGGCQFHSDLGVGWASGFMQLVNASFPHANHTFINAGRVGTILSDFANVACLYMHLPETLDLLVLENLEQLIWRVLQHYATRQQHRPAIILLVPPILTGMLQEPETGCLRNFTRCSTECAHRPFNHTLSPAVDKDLAMRESNFLVLAHGYSFSLLLHRQMLFMGLVHGVPQREGMSACQWLAAMHRDDVHLAPLGKAIFTHYLTLTLSRAEQHLYMHQGEQAAERRLWSSSSNAPLSTPSAATAATAAATSPATGKLSPLAAAVAASTSERSTSTKLGSLAAAAAAAVAAKPATVLALNLAWRDGVQPLPGAALFAGGHVLHDNRCPVLMAADEVEDGEQALRNGSVALVVGMEGWRFSKHQVHGSVRKPKPGWIASTVGARIRIQVNTMFEGGASGKQAAGDGSSTGIGASTTTPTPTTTMLSVSYLASYEHMGVVSITCVAGCECKPAVVNAHHTLKASMLHTCTVEATAVPACEIQVEVLPDTSSGEHKFKVLSVSTSTAVGKDSAGFFQEHEFLG